MSIRVPDTVSERGKVDAKRHRQKQKDAIKKKLPEIIADESIITGKRGKRVKIPIKSIDIPTFRPSRGKGGGVGVGQGVGKPGTIIARKQGDQQQPGKKAGDEPGEDYIETEVEIEELIELMLEDLGLPKLEEKEVKHIAVELGYKITGRANAGIWPLLNKKESARQGMRHFWFALNALVAESGKDELTCFNALKKAEGITEDALKFLKDPNFQCELKEIEAFPIFGADDLRFRRIKPNIKEQSSAVIIAMMDVSGSMSDMKKYLARSTLFWAVEFLRRLYEKVEIRFIIHHATAKIVDEEAFFKTGESGGTLGHTAYDLANHLVDTDYPTNEWNVYVWHFSDGEDFDPESVVASLKNLFAKNINMFAYAEIVPVDEPSFAGVWEDDSMLLQAFKNAFSNDEKKIQDLRVVYGEEHPWLGVVIEKREHILLALKQFLKKEEKK